MLDRYSLLTKVSDLEILREAEQNLLRSPKRKRNSSGAKEGFPYYAGYSEVFAEDALRLFASADALVLDPWNGAGTTSAIAAVGGWSSISFDLNPVMVVVAKARLARASDIAMARTRLLRYLRDFAANNALITDDPVSRWVGASGSSLIRYLVKRCLQQRKSLESLTLESISEKVSAAEVWQCIIILCIFRATKKNFPSPLSSNPTWTKVPSAEFDDVMQIGWKEILLDELLHLTKISEENGREILPRVVTEIKCGTSENLNLPDESIDFVLTSPPYCTRIDYAVSTLCELAVLGLDKVVIDSDLRFRLIGSTANKGSSPIKKAWGKNCVRFLENVKVHPSHGSRTYYYNNFAQYFESLFNSIGELARVLKQDGMICTVLQGSHYKEHFIDLPAIFIEMSRQNGLELVAVHSFNASQFFVNINMTSLKYRGKKSISEQVVILRKCPQNG